MKFFIMNKSSYLLLISLALIGSLGSILAADDKKQDAIPAFPQLFANQITNKRIHIVSEVLSAGGGYETHEEFVDFDAGKMALIITNISGRKVTYIDSAADLIFQYKPYTCIAEKPDDVVAQDNRGLWHADIGFKNNDKSYKMHLYGLVAVWMNAGPLYKTYKKVSEVYVASKNIERPVHRWSIEHEADQELYHLHFYDTNQQGDNRFSLEMVQVESITDKKIKRTMNILSIDYWLPKEEFERILQVPLGYQCVDKEVTEKALIAYPSIGDLYFGPLRDHSHRMKLEVTATWEKAEGKRYSETLGAELIRTNVSNQNGAGVYQLTRYRTASKDIKTIIGYQFNVKHTVDMRRGSCTMSNLVRDERDASEKVTLQFDNGMKLDIDLDMMKFLFVDTTDFYYIKTVGDPSTTQYMYFEKTETGQLFNGKTSRVIRKYVVESKSLTKLESVSIWVYDKNIEKITETYHLNILDSESLSSTEELARLFDISNECYLNNEKMVNGRDYAWFELSYPIASHQANTLAEAEDGIKEQFYNRFLLDGGLSPMRIPKMELMFEDTVMIVRILLLDLPPLTILFDIQEGYTLKEKVSDFQHTEVASDEDHCAQYCRFYLCSMFSFSDSDHTCIIRKGSNLDWEQDLAKNKGGKTFSILYKGKSGCFMPETYSKLNLHSQLALLQHQDYGALALPKLPDELLYPRSETGVSDSEYRKAVVDYAAMLHKFLLEEGHRMPMLTLSMSFDGQLVILMPNKFEVEQDPLAEFDPTAIEYQNRDFDDDKVPAFHHGAAKLRYKINVIDTSKQKNWRLFNSITYDQCALACIDGKCSSFSYCSMRQECILTDNYEVSSSMKDNFVEEDLDCFIAQRDYLSKFNSFPNVWRPKVYKSKKDAFNPSECAHACVAETGFNCLSFDYCEGPTNTCFYLEDRLMHAETGVEERSDKKANSENVVTGCTHYSRSLLADFIRIEYRELKADIFNSLVRSGSRFTSVDQCAEKCVDSPDCSVFQFCYDQMYDGQYCTTLSTRSSLGLTKSPVVIDVKDDGNVVESGKLFTPNVNCHVFALRKDSFEARSRDQMIDVETVEEYEAAEKKKKEMSSSSGISLVGGLFLYVCLTLVFAGVGCGIIIAKQRNNYLGQRIERVQIALGMI